MRALKLALLILALLPTFFLRTPKQPLTMDRRIGIVDLMPTLRGAGELPSAGSLMLVGAWRLTSDHHDFGNFSGLAQTQGGLVTVGDRGGVLWFPRPDQPGPWRTRLTRLIDLEWTKYHYPTDAEAVVVEPGTGDLLVAYEGSLKLERYSPNLAVRTPIPLPVLDEWPENQGPEAMTRLADGRTAIVGEVYARWLDRTLHPAFVFKGEPRPNEQPVRFELQMLPGYRPSELAQMPDGRLLVLGRGFDIGGFRSVIAVFAPSDIRPGATVTPRVIAQIDDPRIRENYEGMTVTRERDGSFAIWLISDSNQMVWAQRTLLLKLRFDL
jgi:hypothetical protein